MKGLNHFIVTIPKKFRDKFKTESGFELYMDRRHSPRMVMNNIAEVVEIPLKYEGPIKKGDWLFLDPTVLMWQSYVKGGEKENKNLLDRENALYKIEPVMILMYRPEKDKWICYNDNVFLNRIPNEEKKFVSKHIVSNPAFAAKFKKNMGRIAYNNKELIGQGVAVGDVVHTKGDLFVDIWFDDKQFMWCKVKYLIAVELKKTG